MKRKTFYLLIVMFTSLISLCMYCWANPEKMTTLCCYSQYRFLHTVQAFSWILVKQHCQCWLMVVKLDFMLGIQSPYYATSAGGSVFSIPPPKEPHQLWHGASIHNEGHLRGPVTLTPVAERFAVELPLPFFYDC